MSSKKYIIRKYFQLIFLIIRNRLRGYYIMLDGCDAMDIQWKDKPELILLVVPFTTSYDRKGNRSIII
jgi:hypothetical protein